LWRAGERLDGRSFVNAVRAREFPKELARFRSLSQIRHLREQIGQLETGRIILRRALDRQAGELDRFGAIARFLGVARGEIERPSVWISLVQSLDAPLIDILLIQFYGKHAIL